MSHLVSSAPTLPLDAGKSGPAGDYSPTDSAVEFDYGPMIAHSLSLLYSEDTDFRPLKAVVRIPLCL